MYAHLRNMLIFEMGPEHFPFRCHFFTPQGATFILIFQWGRPLPSGRERDERDEYSSEGHVVASEGASAAGYAAAAAAGTREERRFRREDARGR